MLVEGGLRVFEFTATERSMSFAISTSTMLAGRKVPVVDRLLEELFGVVLLFKGSAESLVRRSFEGGRVVVGADHADRFIAELRQDVLVGMRAASDHRQPALEATGSVRIREKQRPTPQRQDKECVGLLLDLAEVWSVVLHV